MCHAHTRRDGGDDPAMKKKVGKWIRWSDLTNKQLNQFATQICTGGIPEIRSVRFYISERCLRRRKAGGK